MRQLRFFFVLPFALYACAALPAQVPAVESTLQSAQLEVEAARSAAIEARIRLAELNIERRLPEQVAHQMPAVPNSKWERLQVKLRAAESKSQRLSEKLAPAHPEMLAVENEIGSLRTQLAVTSEFLTAPPPISRHDDLDLALRIRSAEQKLEAAQSALARATECYQTALATIVEKPSPAPASVKAREPAASIPVWPWLIASGLMALACLLRGRAKARKKPTTRLRVDQSVKRLVYTTPPADHRPHPPTVELVPKKTPAPSRIVPRRRSA